MHLQALCLLLLLQLPRHIAYVTSPFSRSDDQSTWSGYRNVSPASPLKAKGKTCQLSIGDWVHDESYPAYSSSCPILSPKFNCKLERRPDSDYMRYRWRPLHCHLPRFSGIYFLKKTKGKSVMFVGDSIGENQWESLVCLVLADVPNTTYQFTKGDPFSTFTFLDYDLSISHYKAPYLVDIEAVEGKRVLKLNDISGNGRVWLSHDVLIFNTGHWWNHKGSRKGWDYVQYRGRSYNKMDTLVAMQRALITWAQWAHSNIDSRKTRLFFLSFSPSHYDPTQWSPGASAGNCYGETAPMNHVSSSIAYLKQTMVLERVLHNMLSPISYLNITALSELRKDAHPSIYNGDLTHEQKTRPNLFADCSHWCLPGLPDTWNQIFYSILFSLD